MNIDSANNTLTVTLRFCSVMHLFQKVQFSWGGFSMAGIHS